jgi:hypothetical protein
VSWPFVEVAPVTAPVPDLPIRKGGTWLADTAGGRALEIIEREGGLHVCLATGSAPPHPTWTDLQRVYDYYLRDPLVYVLADRGAEWRA